MNNGTLLLSLLGSCASPHGFARAAPTTRGWHARSVVVSQFGAVATELLLDAERDEAQDVGWLVEPLLRYSIDGGWSVYVYAKRDDYGELQDVAGAGVQYSW